MGSKEKAEEIKENVINRVKDFFHQYKFASDRDAVILIAVKVDHLLYQAIQARLLPTPSSQDELLEYDRALGTFSTRIDIAYRLGLIDIQIRRSLHIFRKIRNKFAHELTDSKLSDDSHKDRISELFQPIKDSRHFEAFKPAIKEFVKITGDDRANFILIMVAIMMELEGLCEIVKPVDTGSLVQHLVPFDF